MVAVSEYSYNDINIKLDSEKKCDEICKKIQSLLKTIPKGENPDDWILNIKLQKIAYTIDDNIKKIDNSR